MQHKLWPYADRLVAKMADSSTQGTLVHNSARTGGVHASTLLREMHKRKSSDITEDELAVYGLLGLAFEDRAELALQALSLEEDWPWRCFRPGEVEEDGIKCSPDILLVPKQAGMPLRELSLKAKWMSCRHVPREPGENEFDLKKWGYILDQCMTYGTPLDTMGAIVLVYFVVGDYTNFKPQVLGWELEWSQQERAETWDEVVRTAYELHLK